MEDDKAPTELRLPLLAASSGDGGASSSSGSEGGGDGAAARRRTTLMQTLVNFLNIFVGTGMQSMPFALARGGWAALLALALVMPLFALSGQLIVLAFDLMPSNTPRTYPELGRAAMGRTGLHAVMLFSFLELFGGSIILIMVAWQMLQLLLPPGLGPLSAMQLAALVSTLCQLPLLFVDIKRLAKLAMVGLTSSGMVLAMVWSCALLDPHRSAMPQQPPSGHHLFSPGILSAIGIFALSSTAHSTLPALRIAMRQPSKFPLALGMGFAIMLGGYASLAAAGYWYFGDAASALVANDLATNSWYTGGRFPIHRILAFFVLVNCLSKVPGLLLVLQDMILSLARPTWASDLHPPRLDSAIRLALFAAATLLALSAYDVLGATLSLLGGLASMCCSLLLPVAFYFRLARGQLRWPARVGLSALLLVGAALVCLITATNLCDMSERCRGRHAAGLALRPL